MAALPGILEKITSKDKDFRYMATSDLLHELQAPQFRFRDMEMAHKICEVVVQQLGDSSSDISNLAITCLKLLVRSVPEDLVTGMLRQLCDTIQAPEKDTNRDIASIALKGVLSEMHAAESAAVVAKVVTPRMMQGISDPARLEVASESLSIMQEVVRRFGSVMKGEHAALLDKLLPLLRDSQSLLRKRASTCIAALVLHLDAELLKQVVQVLTDSLQEPALRAPARLTAIQALGVVSRAAGLRFSKHLDLTVPLVIAHTATSDDKDDELMEACLQSLDSFLLCCSPEARKHVDAVRQVALQHISYDPNFHDDAMDEGEDEEEEEEEEEEEDQEQYSDDEDSSWKVRRASCKVLASIASNWPDMLPATYAAVMPVLKARFREREESVRRDVLLTLITLLSQVGALARKHSGDASSSPAMLLVADSDKLLQACARQLREKSLKLRTVVFQALHALLAGLPPGHIPSAATMLPGITAALTDKASSSSLKIEALRLVQLLAAQCAAVELQPLLPQLLPAVLEAVRDSYYKIVAEGLRTCELLVPVLRNDTSQPLQPGLTPLVAAMRAEVATQLGTQDQDQEVKEAAIACASTMVALLADVLGPDVQMLLARMQDRLNNESTRLQVVRAFGRIGRSSFDIDLASVLDSLVASLISFLRKADHSLPHASLTTLQVLVSQPASHLSEEQLLDALAESTPHVRDADLQLAALALRLAAALLKKLVAASANSGQQLSGIMDKLLERMLQLVQSPLLQGSAQEALQAMFAEMVSSNARGFDDMLQSLLQLGGMSGTAKTAQLNAAQCAAQLCVAAGEERRAAAVAGLVASVGAGVESTQRMALLCLGALGQSTDLTRFPEAEAAIMEALRSSSEDVKAGASVALGGVAVGNLEKYLPHMLSEITSAQAGSEAGQTYLLLKALAEVISSATLQGSAAVARLEAESQRIVGILLASAERSDEIRMVAAECLGRLALVLPGRVLPVMARQLSEEAAADRMLVVMALKYMIQHSTQQLDELLSPSLLDFLKRIADPHVGVRRAAVQALSCIAHSSPSLVLDKLPVLLPLLYQQTALDPNLIREVNLGPFKHRIDEGLELRKAVFECMDILLDFCWSTIDMQEFVTHLEGGLQDHDDVKLPCHLMLAKLARNAPAAVLSLIDRLVEPLKKTLTARLKSDAVKQEVDRHQDMLRSCLRAVLAISKIPEASSVPAFKDFMQKYVVAGNASASWAHVQREATDGDRPQPMDMS